METITPEQIETLELLESMPLDRLKHSVSKREKPTAQPKLIKDELSDWQKLIAENKTHLPIKT